VGEGGWQGAQGVYSSHTWWTASVRLIHVRSPLGSFTTHRQLLQHRPESFSAAVAASCPLTHLVALTITLLLCLLHLRPRCRGRQADWQEEAQSYQDRLQNLSMELAQQHADNPEGYMRDRHYKEVGIGGGWCVVGCVRGTGVGGCR
jgi:hypothetical protein